MKASTTRRMRRSDMDASYNFWTFNFRLRLKVDTWPVKTTSFCNSKTLKLLPFRLCFARNYTGIELQVQGFQIKDSVLEVRARRHHSDIMCLKFWRCFDFTFRLKCFFRFAAKGAFVIDFVLAVPMRLNLDVHIVRKSDLTLHRRCFMSKTTCSLVSRSKGLGTNLCAALTDCCTITHA